MSLKPKRILVVEDERLVAEDIAECLRDRGFEVCGLAKSADEAIALAQKHQPDLALMDIVIQGDRDGIETAMVLKSEFQIPVIFLTAYSQQGILERAKKVAPLGYVVKPFEEGSLLSTVEIALHKSSLDEELRKSEEWFSTTLNSIGDGVIATDAEGNIKYLNHLAQQMTAWGLDDAEGQHIEKIFPIYNEFTRARVANPAVEALESGEIRELAKSTILVARDGTELPIEDSGAPIRNPEGEMVGSVLIFRDVTEKKKNEKEVIRYQQHLEELVADRTAALARRVELERMVIEISADLIKLGESTYADGIAKALGRIGESLNLDLCGVFEAVSDEGRQFSKAFAFWGGNPEMEKLIHVDHPGPEDVPFFTDQLKDSECFAISSLSDVPDSALAERALMKASGLESMIILPLGAARPAKWSIIFASQHPYDWSEDDLVMFEMLAVVFKNVIERRELEAEQSSLQEQLHQSQKLEAIGKLSGGIAHDFNNMLVPIIGYADVILSNGGNGRESNPEVQEIRKAAVSAASLTRQLLAFSRKQILDRKRLSLNKLVTNVDRLLQRLLGEDVHCRLELADDLPDVRADRGQLEQVLINLSVNARDAMPEGGELTIRTRSGVDSLGKKTVVIEVIDSGSGIERVQLDKIFDPFFTTKGMEGTGLGLSVVLGVMQQHEGWVDVTSELGEGTTFTLGMHALGAETEQESSLSDPDSANSNDTQGHGERILLVEDEPAVIQFVSRALEGHGYEIVLATTKAMAIEIFAKEEGRFDMVFTDAKLPDGNGIEILEYISGQSPEMPALLSSGYTDDRALVDQARSRGVEFLQKPYPLDLLYQTVSEVLKDGQRSASKASSNLVALIG